MNHSKQIYSVLALAVLPILTLGFSGCFEDRPVAGERISMTNFAHDPMRSSVFFSSTDVHIMVPDMHSAGDPTMNGGFIQLRNPMTQESDVYNLPAANWTVLPAPEQGYRYLDMHHQDGPCQYVVVSAGKRLLASCRGAGVKFTLDEMHQGMLDISVTLGTAGGPRYCASFGGHVMRDVPVSETRAGSFQAVLAPAPASCES